MKKVLLFAAFTAAFAAISPAQTYVDVASASGGPYVSQEYVYAGQSFTAGASANNITFNFYNGSSAPEALGTGYLFSTAYTGSPNQLSSSDAGFLGMGNASFGKYNFTPSLTLRQGATYYFYSSYDFAPGELTVGTGSTNGLYSYSTSANTDFAAAPGFFYNYQVDGTTVTPEPSAFLLLGSGVLGGFGMLRRKLVR